jgi:ABC-2 type transport system permease protein
MLAVYKREMQAYFTSPLVYVYMGAYLLITGVFFSMDNLLGVSSDLSYFFGDIQFITIILLPILTMRLFTDERRNKTDQLLITSPLSVWDIVLGKYFAACSVFFLTLCITAIYMGIIAYYGTLAVASMFANYLGLFLLGAGVIAIGVMISAMTESQIIACVATVGAALLLQMLQYLRQIIPIPYVPTIIGWLSIYERVNVFASNMLSLSAIVYMISFCGVFVFLAMRVIEKRRWSEA